AGRLQTITQGPETFTYSYDVISRMTGLSRPNGVTTTYSYDNVDRLQRIEHKNASGTTLEDLQFAFNLDDEIVSITSLAASPLLPQSKAISEADAANRIAQFGPASYGFDVEGQTTTKTDSSGTAGYQWDVRGRLTQATLPNGQTVRYGYDALGRRANRTFNGVTTTFLYDGGDVVLDREGSTATDYLNGAGVDEKLRQTSNIGNLYFLHDHLGSTSALTNSAGGVVERLQYEAFGATVASQYTRYGYTGREWDDATGLMHYRARWYDPQQGRFLTEDPIGFAGGLNLYQYVGNSPLNHTAPSSEVWFIPVLVAAGRAGLNVAGSMLLSTALGQCYGWRDVAADFFFMGVGKGLKFLKQLMRQSGHLDDFLRYGGGGLRHFGGAGRRLGGSLYDIGRGIGKALDDIQPTFRGHSGLQNAEQRIKDAFEHGINPRGGADAPQTLDNLIESINSGSRNSGWVQSSESLKVAQDFATKFGERGGTVFDVLP